jgi:hypothetical protein
VDKKEVWKDIPGYEGYYQVSNIGKVRGLNRINNINQPVRARMMSLKKTKNGYISASLSKNGKTKHIHVHRLMAMAFIPNLYNLPCVNHINGIKADNRIKNLEWCTWVYNNWHKDNILGKNNKGKFTGENNPMAVMTDVKVIEVRNILKKYKVSDGGLSRLYKVNPETIRRIRLNKIWKHVGV